MKSEDYKIKAARKAELLAKKFRLFSAQLTTLPTSWSDRYWEGEVALEIANALHVAFLEGRDS